MKKTKMEGVPYPTRLVKGRQVPHPSVKREVFEANPIPMKVEKQLIEPAQYVAKGHKPGG